MPIRFVVLCLLVCGADALAADATDASGAPSKPIVRRVVAPTVSETRVVVLPDGSLSFVCNERPNPKATQLIQKARATHAVPDQHP